MPRQMVMKLAQQCITFPRKLALTTLSAALLTYEGWHAQFLGFVQGVHSSSHSFMVPHTSVLSDTAFTLGKLPGPWWNTFEGRRECFEENGEPKPPYEMDPIQVQLERIGVEDMPPTGDDRRRLAEAE